jgi:ATP-dependent Lon protease
VGGIKEKVLAAHRAGLKIVILPKQNARDLEDVPQEVRKSVEFVLAEQVDDVFEVALVSDVKKRRIAKRRGKTNL